MPGKTQAAGIAEPERPIDRRERPEPSEERD